MCEREEPIGAPELFNELDITLEDELLLGRIELLERLRTLLLTDELLGVTPLHTAPVIAGRCAGLLATPLFPCTPNSTV